MSIRLFCLGNQRATVPTGPPTGSSRGSKLAIETKADVLVLDFAMSSDESGGVGKMLR